MEKKILAVLLIFLGVTGLVMAEVNYSMGAAGSAKVVTLYAVFGALSFFGGFGLLPFSEKITDPSMNEEII